VELLVLARTPDAPAGTKGLSLFIVPKVRPDGTPNDVTVGGIEHKMGIKASTTAVLNFGEGGGCIGELVGTTEQKGMSQMFHLMNYARIGVGIQSLAIASSAYLNALDYARERKQGSSIKQWKDATAPRVPIIEHPDVRRMLLDMKARVEGIRALAVKLTMHIDRANALEKSGDKAAAEYHVGQVDLLVPLIKAYGSDQAFQICATAIQVYGGAGYLKDWPVEQYCRDSKIFSIYEGTNHIQAMDLVGRKLMQRGGANVQAFGKDVAAFVAAHRERFQRIENVQDFKQVKALGKIGILIGQQNSAHFRTVEDVDRFYNLGQRVSQLTYRGNKIGGGSSDRQDDGLSSYGVQVVERMNDVGMAVDISHCGDRTTLQAIEVSRKPVLVTHSNCRALVPGSARCKTNEAIQRMAAKGGVMGITMVRSFVRSTGRVTMEHVLDHIDHLTKLVGVEHAGIGSDVDLDGRDTRVPSTRRFDLDGIDYARKIYDLTEGLVSRNYSDRNIELILGGNFERALSDTWTVQTETPPN